MKALKFIMFTAVLASGVSALACDKYPTARAQGMLTIQPGQATGNSLLAAFDQPAARRLTPQGTGVTR